MFEKFFDLKRLQLVKSIWRLQNFGKASYETLKVSSWHAKNEILNSQIQMIKLISVVPIY